MITEKRADELAVGDLYDTRCGVADLAFQTITSVERFTLPGGGDRVEISYTGDAICNSRILVGASTVRVKTDDPAPAQPASEFARSICPVADHQPKRPRRSSGKVGSTMSTARRRAVLLRLAERVNSGVLTAASYLRDLGADDDTVRRYASTLGKRVKALAAAKGITPALSGLAVVGRRLVRCLAYSPAEIEILRSATADYTRTAHLIGS